MISQISISFSQMILGVGRNQRKIQHTTKNIKMYAIAY